MVYDYTDTFMTDSIDPAELEAHEAAAIAEVESLNIADEFFRKELVVCRTYMLAAREQIESDGMAEKYKVYKGEFDRTLKLAVEAAARAAEGKTGAFGTPRSVTTGAVERG